MLAPWVRRHGLTKRGSILGFLLLLRTRYEAIQLNCYIQKKQKKILLRFSKTEKSTISIELFYIFFLGFLLVKNNILNYKILKSHLIIDIVMYQEKKPEKYFISIYNIFNMNPIY